MALNVTTTPGGVGVRLQVQNEWENGLGGRGQGGAPLLTFFFFAFLPHLDESPVSASSLSPLRLCGQ